MHTDLPIRSPKCPNFMVPGLPTGPIYTSRFNELHLNMVILGKFASPARVHARSWLNPWLRKAVAATRALL